MVINKKIDIKKYDAFYTKRSVALECYKIIKETLHEFINKKTLWIEPSAGDGSFLDAIDGKKIGFDICPQRDDIEELDFLESDIIFEKIKHDSKNTIIIGNPPFGKRSTKAIEFFNRGANYADTVAFILPNQFKKYSVQSKLNKNFKLIKESILDANSFLANDKDYDIRCVFQIWTCLETSFDDLKIKEPPKTHHKDFEMFQYNNTTPTLKYFDKEKYAWDFAVPRQGFYDYSLKIEDEKKLNKKIQWIFFKAKNKTILKKLKNLDFEKLAQNNTAILGFGKHDVVSEYINLYG